MVLFTIWTTQNHLAISLPYNPRECTWLIQTSVKLVVISVSLQLLIVKVTGEFLTVVFVCLNMCWLNVCYCCRLTYLDQIGVKKIKFTPNIFQLGRCLARRLLQKKRRPLIHHGKPTESANWWRRLQHLVGKESNLMISCFRSMHGNERDMICQDVCVCVFLCVENTWRKFLLRLSLFVHVCVCVCVFSCPLFFYHLFTNIRW